MATIVEFSPVYSEAASPRFLFVNGVWNSREQTEQLALCRGHRYVRAADGGISPDETDRLLAEADALVLAPTAASSTGMGQPVDGDESGREIARRLLDRVSAEHLDLHVVLASHFLVGHGAAHRNAKPNTWALRALETHLRAGRNPWTILRATWLSTIHDASYQTRLTQGPTDPTGVRRVGLPAEALPELGIPSSAPLLFGFHSIHRGNQATEESITITRGPLAGGTTAHVSRIVLDVGRWQAKSRDEQAALLYAPTVTAAQAEVLGDDAPSDYQRYEQTVREHGIVGHAQAAARARVDNVPVINRRDFATVDDGRPGTHFVSLQRELRDFNNTRAIMNGADGPGYHRSVAARRRNGINAFFDVTNRVTLAIPSRARRAYPYLRSAAA